MAAPPKIKDMKVFYVDQYGTTMANFQETSVLSPTGSAYVGTGAVTDKYYLQVELTTGSTAADAKDTLSNANMLLTASDFTVVNGSLADLAAGVEYKLTTGTLLSDAMTPETTMTANQNKSFWVFELTPGTKGSAVSVQMKSNQYTNDDGSAWNSESYKKSFTLDAIAPKVASIVIADTNLVQGESTKVDITFTEAVRGFGLDDIEVSSGKISGLYSLDNRKWTAVYTPDDAISGSDTISIGNATSTDYSTNIRTKEVISDMAGNAFVSSTNATSKTINIDTNTAGDALTTGGRNNDNLIATKYTDVLNGGSGIDTISYYDANATLTGNTGTGTNGVYVSLDMTQRAKADKDKTLQNTDFSGTGSNGSGWDTLIGFENIIGSGNDDQLTGDKYSNLLSGMTGEDVLYGGWGSDILTGGATDKDTFVYRNTAESTALAPDIITDFEVGVDVIDVSAFTTAFKFASLDALTSLTSTNKLLYTPIGENMVTSGTGAAANNATDPAVGAGLNANPISGSTFGDIGSFNYNYYNELKANSKYNANSGTANLTQLGSSSNLYYYSNEFDTILIGQNGGTEASKANFMIVLAGVTATDAANLTWNGGLIT